MRLSRFFLSLVFPLVILVASLGCRSHGVVVIVRNDSGADIRNLEVQYPGGSFGKSLLLQNGSYNYRVKVLREGDILIAFDDSQGTTHRSTGPAYPSNADGTLTIEIRSKNAVTFSQH